MCLKRSAVVTALLMAAAVPAVRAQGQPAQQPVPPPLEVGAMAHD